MAFEVIPKEIPLLFTNSMVRAIYGGTKTVTRRTRGLAEVNKAPDRWKYDGTVEDILSKNFGKHIFRYYDFSAELLVRCPFGEPGAILWVRETWKTTLDAHNVVTYHYAADYSPDEIKHLRPWRPSIFMPRWAFRLRLKRTKAIVPERLREITVQEVRREGFDPQADGTFEDGWNKINGKRPGHSWESNPWVWPVSFKRLENPTC